MNGLVLANGGLQAVAMIIHIFFWLILRKCFDAMLIDVTIVRDIKGIPIRNSDVDYLSTYTISSE